MSKTIKYLIGAVVLVVVAITIVAGVSRSTPSPAPVQVGDVRTVPDDYPNGLTLGNVFANYVPGKVIDGQNSGYWYNNTGRTVFLDRAEIYPIANAAGTQTASSTFVFYVATSSTAAFADNFARPTNSFMIIDGATMATSSRFVTFNSTSTTAGTKQSIAIQPNQYVVVQMMSQFGCTSNGACETATSTNRGFNFRYNLLLHAPI